MNSIPASIDDDLKRLGANADGSSVDDGLLCNRSTPSAALRIRSTLGRLSTRHDVLNACTVVCEEALAVIDVLRERETRVPVAPGDSRHRRRSGDKD